MLAKPLPRTAAAVLLCLGIVLVARPCRAQDDCDYNAGSIHGDYAVVAEYGANAAVALGVQYADGEGHVHGSAAINQPNSSGGRTIVKITFTGDYQVSCNGTGRMLLTLALPGGTEAKAIEDFVITRSQERDGRMLATQIVDAQEETSRVIPGGVFVKHTYTRRPE